MLDSIDNYKTIKLLENHIFVAKTSIFYHLLRNVIKVVITQRSKSLNSQWFIDFIA